MQFINLIFSYSFCFSGFLIINILALDFTLAQKCAKLYFNILNFPHQKLSFLGGGILEDHRYSGRSHPPAPAPSFKTALRTVEAVDDIAVRVLTDDGAVGYGEAPPTAVITGDTEGSILCAIRDYIRPALLGMDVENLEAVMEKLNGCLVHNTTPKAAVDMALYDLWAKAQGKPLYQLLGGADRVFKPI